MRAVVDTNILVSGLLRGGSVPALVLQGIAARRSTPVMRREVIDEYRSVLRRPRLRLLPQDVTELIALIESTAEWVEVVPYAGTPALPDTTDWPFIACALSADCPVITGNARDFPAALGVRVISARQRVELQ